MIRFVDFVCVCECVWLRLENVATSCAWVVEGLIAFMGFCLSVCVILDISNISAARLGFECQQWRDSVVFDER